MNKGECPACGQVVAAGFEKDGYVLSRHKDQDDVDCPGSGEAVGALDYPETRPVSQVISDVMDNLVSKGELSPSAAKEFNEMVARTQEVIDIVLPPALDQVLGEGLMYEDRRRRKPPIVNGLREMQADITDYVPEEGLPISLKDILADMPADQLDALLSEVRPAMRPPLAVELRQLLNHHSAENTSNTPDYVLSEYMLSCLAAFDKAVLARAVYYGEDQHVGEQ